MTSIEAQITEFTNIMIVGRLYKKDELIKIARNYGIKIAEDKNNPTGIDIKTIEDFEDKFELRNISSASAVGHYLGYGIKIEK